MSFRSIPKTNRPSEIRIISERSFGDTTRLGLGVVTCESGADEFPSRTTTLRAAPATKELFRIDRDRRANTDRSSCGFERTGAPPTLGGMQLGSTASPRC